MSSKFRGRAHILLLPLPEPQHRHHTQHLQQIMQRPDPNMSTAERALRLAILLGFTEADGKTPCVPKELTVDEATAREPIVSS